MTQQDDYLRPFTQTTTNKQNKIRTFLLGFSLLILLIGCSPQAEETIPQDTNDTPTQTAIPAEPTATAPVPTPTAIKPTPISQSDLDIYLDALVEAGFAGSILVTQHGETLINDAYGLADIANELPITTATVFDSGSLSKQFTAAAILQLQEQRLLELDDTLADYFDDVPEDKASITIHQLLTHTSGLPGYVYNGDFEETSRDEAQAMAFQAELVTEPGTEHLYSDTGYGLLAIIVELVSGQDFTTYLHDNLFTPAGMESTGFYNDPRWNKLTVANGYFNGEDFGTAATRPGPYWGLLGFGGVLSTTGDFYKWGESLKNHTILAKESVDKLFTPYVQEFEDGDSYYGYGWAVLDHEEYGRVIFHDGATDSQNAVMIMVEKEDTVIIVMSNQIEESATNETFYGTDTGFALGISLLSGDYSTLPDYAQ